MGLCWSSEGEASWASSWAHLPMKSTTGRALQGRILCKQFQWLVLVLYCLLKLVYADRRGKDIAPASSFVPRERNLCSLLSGKLSQKRK